MTVPHATKAAKDLLRWYDAHARDLPWRVSPQARKSGVRPNPYHVWLSEIMLQQTTVAAVKAYFEKFLRLWPSVEALAAADDADVMAAWAGLGYYARARNLLKCAREVAKHGAFPDHQEGLLALPGIGPYTSAAIAAIAFDQPAVVMDGNVERVMARIYADETPLPAAKPILKAFAAADTPASRPGDYAQAVMDLGATICTPKSPDCGICPWAARCKGRAQGIAATLPRKTRKAPKPIRQGIAYFAYCPTLQIALMLRRPDRGLLGGMLALPSTDWAEATPPPAPPLAMEWLDVGEVRHTFTHFHLRLRVQIAHLPSDVEGLPITQAEAMPTVFKKAVTLGRSAFEGLAPPQGLSKTDR